ncbi:hypothetical protein [Spirosoma foliorum]|uniref:Uncharacterized protein n=1 Tax=Spirosoma foliorum TaxID=2710596 RepID=A0A7G5GY85_9BACT|nr:hypothetical protein [Spirosoma foliorum]QMW03827.1 hypothetical protein H3H32_02385 [Spirosoma foliorum]
MRPDKELDQIEPLLADPVQLLAELTVNINQRFDQFQQELSDVKTGQQLILQILREKLP